MPCKTETLEKILAIMDKEKSIYTITRDSGISHMTVIRALTELRRREKSSRSMDGVGQVYPRWLRI